MFVREGFWLGPIFIYYYGILIMSGAVAATFLAARLAKRNGENPETIWDMLPWLLIGGIVGARLWHIFTPPASMVEQGITTMYYLTHPLDAINIRSGGLGIPGAVMGGVFALWLYCRKKKLKMMVWMDLIAPGLALAQAIGRWGNFLNQELYGAPSSLPWAITIDAAHRVPGYEAYSTYHPLFLYEFLWNLFVMGLLLYIGIQYKDHIKNGDIFRVYMFMYPFARFFLEYLRLDPSPVGNININQTLMAVLMVASVGWMVYAYRDRIKFLNRGKPAVETAVENNLVLEASGDLEADTDKSETANPETD
ncbi:MAG TPA: prolipoprotein diacylglyceryl transferase [Anaerolineaceae bacterium]|nr:prolipoprotein diacylglyceryl transferase [Anaerolineaceae bacterium]